tara:strand:- start:57 stop:203 length:147 start_codon:yes stop_codon:yes gene_type:complete
MEFVIYKISNALTSTEKPTYKSHYLQVFKKTNFYIWDNSVKVEKLRKK